VKIQGVSVLFFVRQPYHSVDRDTRWAILEVYGARGKLLDAIILLYQDY
jgi:hypothetical protein